jgi:uncharacterized protein YsxB (DUF464 family)
MTTVIYEPGRLHLRIEGHAGSAPKGEDLVCAGVSALGFALLLAIGDEDFRAEVETDDKSGIIDARCDPMDSWTFVKAGTVLETIAGGLELMAGQYPDYVQYERRG